ncbi:hypothetical protein BCR35DRAFT_299389 [Leucosporidium creatinivorum]|uniref:F-box domain-containing protein n=1 Tax=Leucosporidium creatinivorum TaxID=106004 RepID=A0A1Y2G1Q0_9BASI|nr:hypothetical protein BCR35DRAFT_299389 [Leucosporidium creatinivorum]
MPPTLPTELIQHILDLIYERWREPYHKDPTSLPCSLEGELVPDIFQRFLRVSKTFHALALPIIVRHLFARSMLGHLPRYTSEIAAVIQRRHLGPSVRSLALPSGLPTEAEALLFASCSALSTFYLVGSQAAEASLRVLLASLPSSLQFLSIAASVTLTTADLALFAKMLPNLHTLALGSCRETVTIDVDIEPGSMWPIISAWTLRHLSLERLSGGAAPIVHWLQEAASTLESLTMGYLPLEDATTVFDRVEILRDVHAPFPSLHSFVVPDTGSALEPILPDFAPLHRSELPNLETLSISVNCQSLEQILDTSTTVRRLELHLCRIVPTRLPSALETIVKFVNDHPALIFLHLDFTLSLERNVTGQEQLDPTWSEPLQALCDERGITFACDDHALKIEKGDEAYELSDTGSFVEGSSIGSSGIEEELDFDADDDEIWARQWSEEKRQAMGLVDKVEVEEVEDAEASAPTEAEMAPSTEEINENAGATLATI